MLEGIKTVIDRIRSFSFSDLIVSIWNNPREHLPLIFFFTGFIWDQLTLTRVDQLLDQLILGGYMLLATLTVLLMQIASRVTTSAHATEEGVVTKRSLIGTYAKWYPNIFQLALGALLSGFFVFFSRSGTLIASWPFLLLLVGLLVGNEMFTKRYERFVFQVSVYYFVLFLFLILFVPVFVGHMGGWIFLGSGLLSLFFIVLFVQLLSSVAPERVETTKTYLITSIGGIFLVMNLLYVTNIIPPIPLSLKDAGIYHSVEKLPQGGYRLGQENRAWYDIVGWWQNRVHWQPGTPIYVFTSVFAPTKIETTIYHSWEYYNETTGKWESHGRISFAISGGRDGGYRGYTLKNSLKEGKWRVDVETARGQLLGRKKFTVERGNASVEPITIE